MPGIAAPQIAAPTDFHTKADAMGCSLVKGDSVEMLKLAFWLAMDLVPSLVGVAVSLLFRKKPGET